MSPPILPPRVDSLSSLENPDPELLIAESQKDANEVRDLLASNGEPTRAQLQAALSKVSHRVSELVIIEFYSYLPLIPFYRCTFCRQL
jgi:hypothetical protein